MTDPPYCDPVTGLTHDHDDVWWVQAGDRLESFRAPAWKVRLVRWAAQWLPAWGYPVQFYGRRSPFDLPEDVL